MTRCHVRSTVQSAGKTTLDGGSASQGGDDVGGVPLCPPPPAASVCVGPAASGTGCHGAWSIRTQCPTASPLNEPSRRWCERGVGDGVSGTTGPPGTCHLAACTPHRCGTVEAYTGPEHGGPRMHAHARRGDATTAAGTGRMTPEESARRIAEALGSAASLLAEEWWGGPVPADERQPERVSIDDIAVAGIKVAGLSGRVLA